MISCAFTANSREKVLYDAILQRTKCGDRFVWDQWFLFLFGRKSRCPQCGSFGVEKLHEIDLIDGMYKNPLSYLQKYFGAHLHWCRYCRLQFYDRRVLATELAKLGAEPEQVEDIADRA